MDCKKALTEADGNMEKAIELLRKKGAAVAAKRAEKSANEGLVLTKVLDNGKTGVIVEVNCETDFVAKSNDFISFANLVLETVADKKPANVEEMIKNYPVVQEKLSDVMGKVGEKIEISRFAVDKNENGFDIDYVHLGSKLGVLVKFSNLENPDDEILNMGKDIAMQVAAMKPLCVYREEVPTEVIEKEIDIYKEIARKEGKPEQILQKIADGKLNKYYQENCLFEQAFIKENSKSVGELIKEYNTKRGTEVKLALFHRFHLSDENK
jgi:elongation factor Ts